MKALWIIAPLLVLAPVAMTLAETPAPAPKPAPPATPAPPVVAQEMLECRMEKVRFVEESSTIELEFVLKNRSEKDTIRLCERWNSWGHSQWHFEAKTAGRQELKFVNALRMWWANTPSTSAIEPGKEFRCPCTLALTNDKLRSATESLYRDSRHLGLPSGPGIEFEPRKIDPEPASPFPLKLTGHFMAVINQDSTAGGFTNWKGEIKTEEVTVEK